MAKTFRYLKTDGWIAIANNDAEVLYPFSWWTTQEPGFSLSSSYVYEEYVEGSYHRVFTTTSQEAATFPWANGDIYIAKKSIYDAAYADFIVTPITVEQAKAIKFRELRTKQLEIRRGEVIYSANTYPSDIVSYDRLLTQNLLFTAETEVPAGYYILDINREEISSNLIDLQTITQLIQQLFYACELAYDIHYAAIDALTTIEDIMAYDVTTGWPTIPYMEPE